MINNPDIKKVLFGGDYNPEQWSEETWKEDMRLFKLAGVDIVTLNVFSWASLQKDDDVWDFSQLDKIIDLVEENGLNICLATSTAAHPAWMAKKYPEILRVNEQGIRRQFGGRHNSCPNSPVFHKYSALLARKLAHRYKDRKNIVAWHISNEYEDKCYCEKCQNAFRVWLKERYQTLDALNRAWNTAFWGHTFYDWDEVVVPDQRSEEFQFWNTTKTTFQGISIDYRRFMSDSLLHCYRLEYDAIRKEIPDTPITTNMMGAYNGLDYQKWAPYMDFISWDNYPTYNARPYEPAFKHDLMRGLKRNMPFCLMEQTPSVSNWHPYCELKRPGVMRLLSMQAMAHGADTVMFFQMRQSIGACEKYHGALIGHRGNENTRVFSEMRALGNELKELKDLTLHGLVKSKVALIFDWDNWWATQLTAGPSILLNYLSEVLTWYRYFWEHNIPVDIISVKEDLYSYQMVCAPNLYMIKPGFSEKISSFVEEGGCFITTYFSGYADESDLYMTGGFPGGTLKETLGIWVEESDAVSPENKTTFTMNGVSYPAEILCDLLHPEGAEVLATYDNQFYQGMPAVTRNTFGKGSAYYIATHSNEAFYDKLLDQICSDNHILPLAKTHPQLEVTSRTSQGHTIYYALNHDTQSHTLSLEHRLMEIPSGTIHEAMTEITIDAKDVKLFRQL